jgi:hypothetical protein
MFESVGPYLSAVSGMAVSVLALFVLTYAVRHLDSPGR